MLKDVKENMFLMNEQVENLSRKKGKFTGWA